MRSRQTDSESHLIWEAALLQSGASEKRKRLLLMSNTAGPARDAGAGLGSHVEAQNIHLQIRVEPFMLSVRINSITVKNILILTVSTERLMLRAVT